MHSDAAFNPLADSQLRLISTPSQVEPDLAPDIKVVHLGVDYRVVKALEDVSLVIRPGRLTGYDWSQWRW